jgi:hypothetical protein
VNADREAVDQLLAGSYDEAGIAAWWKRPRSRLGGRSPAQIWDHDPAAVVELARELAGPGDAT